MVMVISQVAQSPSHSIAAVQLVANQGLYLTTERASGHNKELNSDTTSVSIKLTW